MIQMLIEEQNLKKSILSTVEYISNGKNLKIEPKVLKSNAQLIAELPFGIPPCSYLNIKTMNIISSDTKVARRNDFTKFFNLCLPINKRSRIAEIIDKIYAIILFQSKPDSVCYHALLGFNHHKAIFLFTKSKINKFNGFNSISYAVLIA